MIEKEGGKYHIADIRNNGGGFSVGSVVKKLALNAGDVGSMW